MALWDGRFTTGPDEDMVRFSQCMDVDMQMWREDLEGSRAHARGLQRVGLLTEAELATLLQGLDWVEGELESGDFVPTAEHEDIHMAVEARLTELVGEVGGKLHTARSRNDQVATDVRLWMRSHLQALESGLMELLEGLVHRVEADGEVLMPGFTHLQRGQPILLGHHLLAYAWAVQRDLQRVRDCRGRVNLCPLGAGAMAGTPHPIDREFVSRALGFDAPMQNAMDAVAARDHQLEAVAACAIAMTTMSRMAEELVLWTTREFAFVRMAEAYSTGSSIMPQKRNPDAAELVRGKCARVMGSLTTLLTLVKGLPMAYNRDLQEDRRALFDALETTTFCARICGDMWRTLEVHADRYEGELRHDFLLATEIADYLAAKGVPFREAHHVSGRVVAWCEEQGGHFELLTEEHLREFHSELDAGVLEVLHPRRAAERRKSLGGTAPEQIQAQLKVLRAFLKQVL